MKNIINLAKKIKLLILDVDGILTNSIIFITDAGKETKGFCAQDNLGIKLLLATGVKIAIITARNSNAVQLHMQSLGIEHIYQGNLNKIANYEDLLQKLNLKDEEVAYAGDDLPDVKPIRRAGLGISVPNAHEYAKDNADWITAKLGGRGAVREICELIMRAQGTLSKTYNTFL